MSTQIPCRNLHLKYIQLRVYILRRVLLGVTNFIGTELNE